MKPPASLKTAPINAKFSDNFIKTSSKLHQNPKNDKMSDFRPNLNNLNFRKTMLFRAIQNINYIAAYFDKIDAEDKVQFLLNVKI